MANNKLIDAVELSESPASNDYFWVWDSSINGLKRVSKSNLISGVGTGDVVGPSGASASNFASFDGATGKILKDSGSTTSTFSLSGHTHSYVPTTRTINTTSPINGGSILNGDLTLSIDKTSALYTKEVEFQIVLAATDVDGTSGLWYFNMPSSFNGMNLIRAQGYVDTAGTTNATTIQVRNMTKYSSNDALSGAISIASGGTVGTAGTVNTSYDDVATDDLIKVYVTAQSSTKPKGLRVCLQYQLP